MKKQTSTETCWYCGKPAVWHACDPVGRSGYACRRHISPLLERIGENIGDHAIKVVGVDWEVGEDDHE